MATKKIKYDKNDVAIVGIGCRFPDAESYGEFWENLISGKNSIKEINRWDIGKFFSEDLTKPNTTNSKWCGMIDNIDMFDNQFFNISPREAKNMDPQQRLLMEEAWHCIEDSGVPLSNLQDKTTSVYIGVMATDYHQEASSEDVIIDSYAGLGNYDCILANRISYFFGFNGVSMAVDAACASSLVSIHQARLSLVTRESDYVLAGGVTLNTHPWKYISFGKSRMFSPDGQCKTFDKDANGYVPGEGIAVVLMQRLEDAIREGNHVYGLIKGSSVNHGGTTKSITAPRVEAQQDLILTAYKRSGFCPETVNYMEAHGTGTSLGDPIEVEALTKAFKSYIPYELGFDDFENNILKRLKKYEDKKIIEAIYVKYDREERYVLKDTSEETINRLARILKRVGFITHKNQFCTIGSVKTNIGHLEAAAGIAGVIKVLMMLKHKKIPPILNLKTPNPIIKWDSTPFVLARGVNDWKPVNKNIPLRAGVSSFGFGGVNSHALIEEFNNPFEEEKKAHALNLFTLSAKSKKSFSKLIENWKEFTASPDFDSYSLESICTTLAAGRASFSYRWGRKVSSKEDLIEKLNSIQEPYTAKTELEWCVRIGNFVWKGYKEIMPIIEAVPSFKANLEDHFDYLLFEVQMLDNIKDGYYEEKWDKKYVDLYSFITGYVYIRTLYTLGFNPTVITAEGQNILLGLVLSEIINLADAVLYLSGEKEVKDILFKRPTIPYYDNYTGQTIMPFYFTEEYLQKLVKEVTEKNQLLGEILVNGVMEEEKRGEHQSRLGAILIRNGILTDEQLKSALDLHRRTGRKLGDIVVEKKFCTFEALSECLRQQDILHYYIDEVLHIGKARLLSMSQFTFKRYLEEWDSVLKKRGKDIHQMLHDKDLISQQDGRLPNEKLLLMVIIMSSLKQLYKKWNLADQKLADEKWFYEMIDLVVDGVIPKECIVELFLEKQPDFTKIIHIINTRQKHAKRSKSYVYIRELDKNISDLGPIDKWLEKVRTAPGDLPDDEMAYMSMDNFSFLKLGEVSGTGVDGKKIIIDMERDIFEAFKDSLLSLWLSGQIIDWKKLNNNGIYKKAQLPLYPYSRKSFWISKKAGTKVVKDPVPALKPGAAQKAFTYKPEWQKAPLKSAGESQNINKAAIVFVNDESLSSELCSLISSAGYKTFFFVNAGGNYLCNGVNYTVNLNDETHFKNMFKDIAGKTSYDFHIYYLWGYQKPSGVLTDYDQLEKKLFDCIKPLFFIAKNPKQRPVSIVIPTKNAMIVKEKETGEGFLYGSLTGMIKTIMLENRDYMIKTIDFDAAETSAGEAAKLLQEIKSFDTEPIIAYRDDARYVKSQVQVTLAARKTGVGLKEDGVYLFIGGAGGIGQKITAGIVNNVKAKVIMVGRSELNSSKEAAIKKIEKAGCTIDYMRADVTDPDQVKKLISRVKEKYGSINGVIQSGGILEDTMILFKKWDSFERVMASKVKSTWLINELTKNEPLDFFAVFSSIVAVIGNKGQVDYAAANSFLDSFISRRNAGSDPGIGVSINWTLWADGGMGLDDKIIEAFSKHAGVIYSKDGSDVFNNAVGSDVGQCIVVGNPGFFDKKAASSAPAAAAGRAGGQKTPESGQKELTSVLKSIFSQLLEMSLSDIDSDELFGDMGVDSIMMGEIVKKLEGTFGGINLDPSNILEHPTINQLADYLQSNFAAEISAASESAAEHAGPAVSSGGDLRGTLKSIFSELLEMAESDIDSDELFGDMGVDSIMMGEIVKKLEGIISGVSLDPSNILEHPTINQLADYLQSNFSSQLSISAPSGSSLTADSQAAVTGEANVAGILTSIFAQQLEMAESDIEPDELFGDMGVDSIMMGEIVKKIEGAFGGISLDPSNILEHPTIIQLNDYLCSVYPEIASGRPEAAAVDYDTAIKRPENDEDLIALLKKLEAGVIDIKQFEELTEGIV